MPQIPPFLRAAALLSTAVLASCATYEEPPAPGRPYTPSVLMPVELNANESQYIQEVEGALEDSGLRPSGRQDSEYTLTFSLEDGPVNADSTLKLFRGRQEVAGAFARVGGPRIVFSRRAVVRESFQKALADFEHQISGIAPGGRGGQARYDEPDRRDPEEDYRDAPEYR